MADLISGEEVRLPKFNFKTGKREEGRLLKVPLDQPIIIEGIHALNDKMTKLIPSHQKFKIFIAPQAQVNIDNHNPLSQIFKDAATFFIALVCAAPPTRDTDKPESIAGL